MLALEDLGIGPRGDRRVAATANEQQDRDEKDAKHLLPILEEISMSRHGIEHATRDFQAARSRRQSSSFARVPRAKGRGR